MHVFQVKSLMSIFKICAPCNHPHKQGIGYFRNSKSFHLFNQLPPPYPTTDLVSMTIN